MAKYRVGWRDKKGNYYYDVLSAINKTIAERKVYKFNRIIDYVTKVTVAPKKEPYGRIQVFFNRNKKTKFFKMRKPYYPNKYK